MKKLLSLLCSVLLLISCGPTIQVFSDHDQSVPITGYTSFGWMDIKSIESKNKDPRLYNELTNDRIKKAVNIEMLAKGMQLATGNGQLQLHYHLIIDDKTSISSEPFGFSYGPYWKNRMTQVYQYREGTLIIDIMDSKTNQLVWRGWATDVITEKAIKHPEEAIQKGVKAIFEKFPGTR